MKEKFSPEVVIAAFLPIIILMTVIFIAASLLEEAHESGAKLKKKEHALKQKERKLKSLEHSLRH